MSVKIPQQCAQTIKTSAVNFKLDFKTIHPYMDPNIVLLILDLDLKYKQIF